MFRVELGKTFHRPRSYVLGAALAVVAVIPALVASQVAGSEHEGPPFLELVTRNGLFAGLAAIGLIQPFFLPLGAALLSGESVASEASGGTLRYLLVRPVGRLRLVGAKYAATVALLVIAVAWVALVGLAAGGIVHGYGPLPTLSGDTISAGAGLLRVLGVALYVAMGAAAVAAIGTCISVMTVSGPGATVATVAVAIVSQILDGLGSFLRPIHPYLPTHDWLAWPDLFRSPVSWDGVAHGILLDGVYTVLFLGIALAVFNRKDVTA